MDPAIPCTIPEENTAPEEVNNDLVPPMLSPQISPPQSRIGRSQSVPCTSGVQQPLLQRRSLNPRDIPEFRSEYEKLIPIFNGEPLALAKYLKSCDKLYVRFYNDSEPDSFQNDLLLSSFTSKLGTSVASKLCLNSIENYPDLREALLDSYSDKRDTYTLTLEMSKLKQNNHEDCFAFHDRVNNHLKLQIAWLQNNFAQNAPAFINYMQTLALRVFLHGLSEPVGSFLRTRAPTSLGSALAMLTNDFNLRSGDKPSNQVIKTPPSHPPPNRPPLNVRPNYTPPPFVPRHLTFQPRPYGQNPNWNRPNQNFQRPFNHFQRNANNPNFQRPQNQNSTQQYKPIGKGSTPSSMAKNTNFNLLTPDEEKTPKAENPEQYANPIDSQYYEPQGYDPYYPGIPYYPHHYCPESQDLDQVTYDFSNSVQLEQHDGENDFLEQTNPPK